MIYFLRTRVFILCLLFLSAHLFSLNIKAQPFDFNDFFKVPAITFYSPDSNNMIYDQLHSQEEMVLQLDSIFPFATEEFYGAYPLIQSHDTISYLPGMHRQLSGFDNKAAEIKGSFMLNNKTGYWYAYYKKSIVDTTTAIVIFPGSGYHESFHIANNNVNDYHNLNCLVKDKSLEYGDVYVFVKPNEDFRSIWKDTGNQHYNKLDYDVMAPYTDFMGKSWASNLHIEFLAQLKYLKSKYKKVITMGLSNGGFPVLVCGLEAEVDGINCASGLSVTSYTGFPVSNNENPYFSNLFNYYSLEHVSDLIHHSATTTLFSYGAGDCCTNAYEYNTHALQNYINTPDAACNADFFYDFSGHTFSCDALDSFFSATIRSPKVFIDLPANTCAYDSLQVLLTLQGSAPFSMDLYRNGTFYRHYNTLNESVNITLNEEGEYYISNLTDAGGYPLCKSKKFNYTKPIMPAYGINAVLSMQNSYLVATYTPYLYNWFKDNTFITSTTANTLPSYGSGEYYVVLKDSSGCSFRSNKITQRYPSNVNIYPNPASADINILVNEKFTGSWTYVIYNHLGQKIISGNSLLPHALLNVQKLPRGSYNFNIEYRNNNGQKIRETVPVFKQ